MRRDDTSRRDAGSGSRGDDDGTNTNEDALTVRHRSQPQRALQLQQILKGLGLASNVFETTVVRKRRFVHDGGKLNVDDARFTGHSFKYFSVDHPLRYTTIRIITNRRFKFWMGALYALSAAMLLVRSDPQHRFPDDTWTAAQYVALVTDRILVLVFASDLVLSFVSHGVLKCMRQTWTIIDVVVLATSIAQEFATGNEIASTVLFAVSSARPLRIISRMRSMQKLLSILVACSEKLLQVALLICGICVLFAIAGVILFREASHTRCWDLTSGEWGPSCNQAVNTDPTDFLYAPCASGTVCRQGAPNLELYYSYDNIGNALLVMIQIFTLDNWTELAVDMMNSLTPAAGVFFVLATFLLAYWATNQFTAVIFDSFSTTFVQDREIEDRRVRQAKSGDNDESKSQADGSPGKRVRFTSSRGAAPQAQRAVTRMKQAIADDSVKSLKTGFPGVNVAAYIREEVAKRNERQSQSAAKNRRNDFFLDDTDTDNSIAASYRFAQLETQLPPPQQALLQAIKQSSYKDERERNLVLNHFHGMSDEARERCLRFLTWRSDVAIGADAAPINLLEPQVSARLTEPLLGDHVRLLVEGESARDDDWRSEDELVSLACSSDIEERNARSGPHAVTRQLPRPGHETLYEELLRLEDEHQMLWQQVSGVLHKSKKKRKEAAKRQKKGAISNVADSALLPPTGPVSDKFLSRRRSILHRDTSMSSSTSSVSSSKSSSSSTSSSSSSSSSSTDSVDTLDRAVQMHQRLERQQLLREGHDHLHATGINSNNNNTKAKSVRKGAKYQRWHEAKTLDEIVLLSDQQERTTEQPKAHSLIDRQLMIDERREANRLLLRVLRQHHHDYRFEERELSVAERLKTFADGWSQRLRLLLYTIIRSKLYDRFMVYATLFNCFMFVFVNYNESNVSIYDAVVDAVSVVVDMLIVLDAVARVLLTSVRTYGYLMKRNIFNVVEFGITVLALLDVVVAVTGIYPFLRVFRVLRLMRYMRRFHLLRQILLLIRTSLKYLLNVLLLQIIVWMMFTFCGRQLFGGTFKSADVLVPCHLIHAKAACNGGTENCIWVNETEYMTWNTSYMIDIKRDVKGGRHSFTRSPSAIASRSLHRSSETRSEGRSSNSIAATRSHTLSPSLDDTKSPSLTDMQTVSLSLAGAAVVNASSPPMDTPAPPADVQPQPTVDEVSDPRVCRQFQGWDSVDSVQRFSFESLTFSFITVFNIVTKDNWSAIQYQYMTHVGSYSVIFFIAVVVVCGYMILALLVAILLVNFEQKDEVQFHTMEDEREIFDQEILVNHGDKQLRDMVASRLAEHLEDREAERAEQVEREKERKMARAQELAAVAQERERQQTVLRFASIEQARVSADGDGKKMQDKDAFDGKASRVPEKLLRLWMRVHAALTLSEATKKSFLYTTAQTAVQYLANFCDADNYYIANVTGRSLFLFHSGHPFRQFAVRFVQGEYFALEKTIFWLTLLHCFVSPASPKLIETTVVLELFRVVDWLIAVAATVEFFLRLVAMGGFRGPHTYWQATGLEGRTDAALVAISFAANLLPVIISASTGGAYKGTAIGFALKGVRPFRAVSRSRTMRNVVVAVWRTVPELVSILGLSTVLYIMFAIMCVQAYRGRLRRCSDGSDRSQAECVGTWIATPDSSNLDFPDGVTMMIVPRRWENRDALHFDNCYNAFTTLFMVSLVSSWSEIMYAMIDAPPEPGGTPVRNLDSKAAGWLIFWVIFSNNFLINIFVGSIVDRFSKLKDQLQGNLFISAEQQEIARIKKSLVTKTAKKILRLPQTPFVNRRLNEIAFAIVSHHAFYRCMKYILIVNTMIIMSLHYNQTAGFDQLQQYGNSLTAIAFLLEGALKICVGGLPMYFSVKFHFVEAAVMGQGVIELAYFILGYAPPNALQILRLIRIIRLVRDAKGLRKILHTGYKALPAMGNIGAVLIALLFAFAMLSIALFQDVRYGLGDQWFSPMFSLRTVPKAMFTLYTVSTLDNWGQVLGIAGVSEPRCNASVGDCGNPLLASLFFNLFIVSVTLIMLNLFMAVVLENFSDAVLLPQYLEERQKDVEAFRRAWSRFDDGRNVIDARNMVPLLQSLPGPMQRFELLKQTRDDAGDDDSAHSLQSDEMRVYAETQTIGLGGCPQGSIIPTVRQLKLVVTMPNEEILYLDAVSAIGEKIYHAQLVDEIVRRTHERILIDTEDAQLPFALWYATLRFQRLYRDRLHLQRQHQVALSEHKLRLEVLEPTATSKPFLPPRHYASGSALWNAVLDPIVVSFVRQHFRSAWTADGTNTKMRKITLTKRGGGGGGENDMEEDDDLRKERLAILEEVERRQTKSLADTIKERQIEVEEAPEVVEDTSWINIVTVVDGGGAACAPHRDPDAGVFRTASGKVDTGVSAKVGWGLGSRSTGAAMELKKRLDPETGATCHVPTLTEVIMSRRKELLFQIYAMWHKMKKPLDGAELKRLGTLTVSELKSLLGDDHSVRLDVWTNASMRWKAPIRMQGHLVPSRVWRDQLKLPLVPRVLLQQRKKKAQVAVSATVVPTLVADWGATYRIADESILAAASEEAQSVVAPTTGADGVDPEDLGESFSLLSAAKAVGAATRAAHRLLALRAPEVVVLPRYPTLRERMEELKLSTVHIAKSDEEEQRALAREVVKSLKTPAAETADIRSTSLFANAPHRTSVTTVRLMLEDGVELSETAKALYLQECRGASDSAAASGGRFTTLNTAGSYELPVEDDNGLPKLSFRAMTLLTLAARRFKRRKVQAEADAMRRAARRGPQQAMSMHSKASRGEEPSNASGTLHQRASSPQGHVSGRVMGLFKKAAARAAATTHAGRQKDGVSFASSPTDGDEQV